MEEQEQPKEEQKEETVSIVDEARAIRDEIRTEREKLEAANIKREKMMSEDLLSGRSTTPKKEEPKEISDKDYAKAALEGTIGDGK